MLQSIEIKALFAVFAMPLTTIRSCVFPGIYAAYLAPAVSIYLAFFDKMQFSTIKCFVDRLNKRFFSVAYSLKLRPKTGRL